jgi:hypothetical protein
MKHQSEQLLPNYYEINSMDILNKNNFPENLEYKKCGILFKA